MTDIFKVAKWEFTKGIKNKAFIFLTFFFPIIMLIIMGVVGYFNAQGFGGKDLNIAIVDQTNFMTQSLQEVFAEEDYQADFISAKNRDEIKAIMDEKDYDGVMTIPADVVDSNQLTYYFKDISGMDTDFLEKQISNILVDKRLTAKGYSPEEINNLTAKVKVDTKSVEEGDEETGIAKILMPFILAVIMIMGIFMSGSILLQSVIKEKGNRIVEIILSSISARTLMIGKIFGYALLSLMQIAIWLAAGLLILLYFRPEAITFLLDWKILLMLLYVVFGFILVASLNAIIASSMKDAQSGNQSSGIFILIPIIPLYFSMPIMNNPTGVLSRVLTFIPVFTPTTMMLRLGMSTPPAWEIIASFAVLIVSTYLLMLLASKLFRIGMLMYGKSASLPEIIRWARSKDY